MSGRARRGRRAGERRAAPARARAGGRRAPAAPSSRRGYNPHSPPQDSEYHYGSDFGDESDDDSEADSLSRLSSSPSPSPAESEAVRSESEVVSLLGDTTQPAEWRRPSPEPLWLQHAEPPPLSLPNSSEDLLLAASLSIRAMAVYELLRRFRHLVRLTPFRVEDMCAALSCDEQSNLLAEIHMALLKALLREEDSQQTHFGPIDHKDSVNISLFMLDVMTWPEVLRIYVESDRGFDRDVLQILNSCEYPFTGPEERIKILEFLGNQFLVTNPVREDLTSEVSIHYDDHCRVCHRLGDLLCCETCPAVFHLECVDPPLVDVPSEDWQCSLCKVHRLQGVTDCISDTEKQGLLCRHEHLGFDRHGRKYWFICRRIFVEEENGAVWYYSSRPQFDELLLVLDSQDMECALYRELMEFKSEIIRQMEITDKITNQLKGSRKSYLEVENSFLTRVQKERVDKKIFDNNGISKDVDAMDDLVSENSNQANNVDDETNSLLNDNSSAFDHDDSSNQNKSILSMSITEDGKKKSDDKSDKQLDVLESQRLTRLKINQISAGTLLFKLGNDNHFRNYVNQYTTNTMALNKPQRNEERDKKRHLAHKFSLTCTQEFKWTGLLNVTRSLLINTLRQTLLQLETNVASVFMHPNWSLLRKPWLQAVHASNVPRDFARAMVVLQACIKSVVFVPVWHEQLGHVRLQRITAGEREERKKLDKREKKEKEEEEERNKVSFFVKYPITLKHQIWKQKGEEYRIHGQWGWLWHSATRKFRNPPIARHSLQLGPLKYIVQVQIHNVNKTIFIEPKTYDYLVKKDQDLEISKNVSQDIKALKPIVQPSDFIEIDIEKALSSNSRIFYPKIAKKSRLDDMLARRVQLKVIEERKFDQNVFLQKKKEDIKDEEEQNVDVENDDNENDTSVISTNPKDSATPSITSKDVANMTKEIQTLRQKYGEIVQQAKGYRCYAYGCNMNNATLSHGLIFSVNCYSPLCIRKANLRKDLLLLLNKVRNSTNNIVGLGASKSSANTSQHEDGGKGETDIKEYANDIIKDLITAVASAQKLEDKHYVDIVKLSAKVKMEMDMSNESDVKPFVCNSGSPVKSEHILEESVIPAIGNEMELEQCVSSENDVGELNVVDVDKVVDNSESEKKIKKERKIRDLTYVKSEDNDSFDGERPPIPKIRISTRGRTSKSTISNVTKKSMKPLYRALVNRRFCSNKHSVKRERVDRVVKNELAPDGSKRVYSAESSAGKIYLKRIVSALDKKKKRIPVRYPLCSTFHTKSKAKSIMVLPAHELRKLSRHGGRLQVNGYNHNSKPNPCVWPYPCSRPIFKTCWLYRTINLSSLAAVCLQIRILWACVRWDDMATKPSNNDGKHQITTETEIISLEMLKHRHIGQFLDKTQYLRRKVVIPLEVPKTVREVTSIRSGLRKRKRAESPQSMEPQVTEEWVDEDKLELWEIKQYGEKVERAVPVTRTTTGKLPPSRSSLDSKENSSLGNAPKSTPQEIKEKMELQLRMQRTAHQQKRALELAQGIVNTNGNKTLIGTRRVFMTKGADGTTRVISQPGILPKTTMQSSQSPGQQSIIKSQLNQPPKDGPQKVQIIRGHDGKLTVRGLIAGQQLLQMPDGKLHVVASSQTGNLPNGGQIIATGGPPPTPKIAVTPQPKPHTKILPTTSTANKPISPVTTTTSTLASNKVVIRQQTPSKPIAQTPDKQTTQTPQRIISQGTQQIVVQGNQQILVQSPQQVVVQAQNRLSQPTLVPVSQATILQQNRPVQAVIQGNQIVQSGQTIQSANVIQGQVVRPMQAQQQIITTNAGPQVVNRMISPGQHIVVNNPALAQQLAAGKLQLASINGQQVLIRPIGNNQALVVAHVAASQNTTNIDATPQNQIPNSPTIVQQNQVVPSPTVGVAPQIVTTIQGANQNPVESQVTQMSIVKPAIPSSPAPVVTQPVVPLTEDQLMEQRLLAGQPPGTVIKTVTAQVVHLDGGPRIVLQGLQGNSLTQQQLQLVQHQVKQQLLKAQEVTGKQGMLGPTKLFLAVQPCPPAGNATVATPATINAVRPQHNQISQDQNKTISALLQSNKSKNVPTTVLINGQDPLEPPAHIVLKPSAAKSESDSQVSSTSNKFVLTPDYIQQTIKNALKQENLNPEIEEKLLQLQKYQERQMKPDSGSSSESIVSSSNIRMLTGSPPMQMQSSSSSSSRRRPASSNRNTDDDDWVESTPRKRNRTIVHHESRIDTMDDSRFTPIASRARPTQPVVQVQEVPPLVQSSPSPSPYSNMPHSPVDERRRTTQQSKLPILLFRHKELLKKDIIKKRGLLEKELGIEIQRELSAELALRTKAERNKQEEVRSNNVISNSSSNPRRRPMPQCSSSSQQSSSHPMPTMSSSSRSKQRKKEKLLCICRKPYDETKFYVGCEHCNNWFHGDCVGITEEMSKTINEFVCNECKHARDTQELYCLCKQPYDNSQFYICCDRCQDWFHGRCVGILQSEADNIDEYICPQCQKNNSVNFANMKELSHKDFENLKKLIKQIQLHRSAWPFMEPVDPREAPMYYKVIKEPMDLQIIEKKINEHSYNMLSELIGDMTKIFDNCRYFNPKESQFYRCAESLEAFFVQRIKFFREKLFESNQ